MSSRVFLCFCCELNFSVFLVDGEKMVIKPRNCHSNLRLHASFAQSLAMARIIRDGGSRTCPLTLTTTVVESRRGKRWKAKQLHLLSSNVRRWNIFFCTRVLCILKSTSAISDQHTHGPCQQTPSARCLFYSELPKNSL
jgi:hypothetical protein